MLRDAPSRQETRPLNRTRGSLPEYLERNAGRRPPGIQERPGGRPPSKWRHHRFLDTDEEEDEEDEEEEYLETPGPPYGGGRATRIDRPWPPPGVSFASEPSRRLDDHGAGAAAVQRTWTAPADPRREKSTGKSVKELATYDDRIVKTVKHINGTDQQGFEFMIPEDTYGATILAVVKEMQDVHRRRGMLRLGRLGFTMLLLTINLLAQFGILLFISGRVVQPAVRHVQQCYFDFHRHVFDTAGNFLPGQWENYEGKAELCQIAMANRVFYLIVLFIWIASMLNEVREIEHFFSNVYKMPLCENDGDMMLVVSDHEKSIIALTRQTRIMLFSLVCIPKLVISIGLLMLGCQWLSATTSFEDLVMNTVAMEFVVHIDELLFLAFLPNSYHNAVRDICFFHPSEGHEEGHGNEWMQFAWAGSYFVLGSLGLIVYSYYVTDVLPHDISEVQDHCGRFYDQLRPLCYNKDPKCYPFGDDASTRAPDERQLRGGI